MLSENNQASLPTPFTGLFYVWLITLCDDYRISPAHWLRRSDLRLGVRLLPFYSKQLEYYDKFQAMTGTLGGLNALIDQ